MRTDQRNTQLQTSDSRLSRPVDERLLTVDDLARMFSVSKKTISRWRDHGLSSGRFDINGRQRVGFQQSSVDRFIAQNPARIRRGANFSQLTDEERDQIAERARLLADSGRSRFAVAKEIAISMDRSVETIRAAIRRYDAAHPESPVFGDVEGTLAEKLQTRIYRAYCQGTSVATLAKTFRRPAEDIRQIITHRRVEGVQGLPLQFMPSPEFENSAASETTFLGAMPAGDRVPRKAHAPSGLPSYLASLYDFPLLTKEQEVHLFRKYNFAKYRASLLRDQLDPADPAVELLDAIERLYKVAVEAKNQIMQANLRLVVAIVKNRAQVDAFSDLVSDGNISLLKAIDKFDYTRGFKFSTYATWAIKRNDVGNYVRKMKQAERYRTGHAEVLDGVQSYRADHTAHEAVQERREATVGSMLECLDERERGIVERRYGLGHSKEPQTLKEIGEDLRVSKERVRQIETRALEKLRKAAVESKAATLIS